MQNYARHRNLIHRGKCDLHECHRNKPNAKLERCDFIGAVTYLSTSDADIGTLLTLLPMLSGAKTIVFDEWQQV